MTLTKMCTPPLLLPTPRLLPRHLPLLVLKLLRLFLLRPLPLLPPLLLPPLLCHLLRRRRQHR